MCVCVSVFVSVSVSVCIHSCQKTKLDKSSFDHMRAKYQLIIYTAFFTGL